VLLVNVPADTRRCGTFGDLFAHLLVDRSMLCLALYRQVRMSGSAVP
jgi:hypothetical protein